MYKKKRMDLEALRRVAGLSAIPFVILLATVSAVEAAEWRIEPVLRLAGDFDDNAYLSIRTDADESQSGYIAEASVKAAYGSDKTNFDIRPTFRHSDYGSNTDLNSNDQFLDLSFGHETVSSSFRIRGSFDHESVRTAERADTDLDVDNPDDILDNDSGRVGVRGERERIRVVPSYVYRMTDNTSLNLRLEHNDVRFDESLLDLLVDYTDTRLDLSFSRAWSSRFRASLGATYRNYQTGQGSNEVNGVGLLGGIERTLSETSRLRLTVGVEDTDVDGGSSQVEPVMNVSYVRRLKTILLLAQYRRSISATGSGNLATRDSLNLNFTRELSDRISAGLGARVYTTNAIDETTSTLDERNYVQLRAQFTWHLSTTFSLETDYRYTFLDRETLGESSNSNQVTVWLNYRPTPIVRSR